MNPSLVDGIEFEAKPYYNGTYSVAVTLPKYYFRAGTLNTKTFYSFSVKDEALEPFSAKPFVTGNSIVITVPKEYFHDGLLVVGDNYNFVVKEKEVKI